MNSNRVVALLPMKAHSERVPAKNFRPLLGRPLFEWVLQTLISIPAIEQIVINTDARAQLEDNSLIRRPQVLIRDRRPDLCGDLVSMNLILADDISSIPADLYLMTHTTNPLLSAATISRALEVFRTGVKTRAIDSLFSVNRHQARFYDENGRPVNHDPARLVRTQDLAPLFEENSTLYLFTAESFSFTQARIGRRPIMFETPAVESFDIDEESDWEIVEALATAHSNRASRKAKTV